jgi:hypothetical protein
VRYANQLPQQIESRIVELKAASRIGARARSVNSRSDAWMAISAFPPRAPSMLSRCHRGVAPNHLWCADFKGEHKLGNGRYCYPLTVTDHASRFLLLCGALESTRKDLAVTAFERVFIERGLPQAIRSDNGVPFASPNGRRLGGSDAHSPRENAVPKSEQCDQQKTPAGPREEAEALLNPAPIKKLGLLMSPKANRRRAAPACRRPLRIWHPSGCGGRENLGPARFIDRDTFG